LQIRRCAENKRYCLFSDNKIKLLTDLGTFTIDRLTATILIIAIYMLPNQVLLPQIEYERLTNSFISNTNVFKFFKKENCSLKVAKNKVPAQRQELLLIA
jgi:hypothetical protein